MSTAIDAANGGQSIEGAAPSPQRSEEENDVLLLEAELGPLDLPAGATLTPETQVHLDRMLYKVRELRQQMDDVQRVADMRIADIQRWADHQNAQRYRQVQYLTMLLEYAADTLPYNGKAKSVSLPNGKLGRRTQQAAFTIVDPAKALAFCKKNGIEYRSLEEPYVGKLKEWAKENNDAVPPGCTVEARPDKPYIQVAP